MLRRLYKGFSLGSKKGEGSLVTPWSTGGIIAIGRHSCRKHGATYPPQGHKSREAEVGTRNEGL